MSEIIAIVIKAISSILKSISSYFKKKKKHEKKEFQKNKRGKYFYYLGFKNLNQPSKSKHPVRSEVGDVEIVFSAFNNRFDMFVPISNYNIKSNKRQELSNPEKKYFNKYLDFHKIYISKFYDINQKKYFAAKDFISLLKDDKKIKYILGEIGCGKSTFISHLLFHARKEISNNTKNNNIAIFCINCSLEEIEKSLGKNISNHVIPNTEEIAYKILNNAFKKQMKKIDFSDLETFKSVIEKHFSNHNVTIILDNLDQLYDESILLLLKSTQNSNDFKDKYHDKNYRHFVYFLYKVILEIVTSTTRVNFILCVRPETYNALETVYTNATGANTLSSPIDQLTIQLENIGIKEIIENRFKLGNIESQSKLLDFAKGFGKAASGLKVNGNRHIMSSLRNVIKDIDIDNIFSPSWLIEIYIYLDGYVKYSQKDCGICNIFLINIDYRKEIDKYDEKFLRSIKVDHCQTYWLKYFICKYYFDIDADTKLNSDILHRNMFGQYELEIFNFCLYSLSEVEHGRLLGCNFQPSGVNTNSYELTKTQRLDYCFNQKIFFNFSYLVVIVDDQWLEIPKLKKYQDYFEELFKPYNYNTSFNIDIELWKEWLFLSIDKVFTFVKILEISFKYEKERIVEKRRADFEIDFKDIFKNLSENVRDISKTLDIPIEIINTKIEKAMNFNDKISNPLENHFKTYAKKVKKFTQNNNNAG